MYQLIPWNSLRSSDPPSSALLLPYTILSSRLEPTLAEHADDGDTADVEAGAPGRAAGAQRGGRAEGTYR